jgi:hypothetical protein
MRLAAPYVTKLWCREEDTGPADGTPIRVANPDVLRYIRGIS